MDLLSAIPNAAPSAPLAPITKAFISKELFIESLLQACANSEC
jgi:hypothetical protein